MFPLGESVELIQKPYGMVHWTMLTNCIKNPDNALLHFVRLIQ